jgi:hypothetical protein
LRVQDGVRARAIRHFAEGRNLCDGLRRRYAVGPDLPGRTPNVTGVYLVETGWREDWLWSLPLIALTVAFHVLVLEFIYRRAIGLYHRRTYQRWSAPALAGALLALIVTLATLAHALEAAAWAFVYMLLGALPTPRLAMLYSLNAMTTLGHTSFDLAYHWQLMGALEALNGILLFGLTTAFLFASIRQFSFAGDSQRK